MKVVFPNSAWVSAPERFVLKQGHWARQNLKVRYGVIVHPKHGPVMIDTGYTPETLSAANRGLMLRLYGRLLAPTLVQEEQPKPVLAQLGFEPTDVRFVIVTHFHADHISGLCQFPNAQFIVNAPPDHRHGAAPLQNLRHGIFTELLPADFIDRQIELRMFPIVKTTSSLPDGHDIFGDNSIISVDLPGHAKGHFGLYIAGHATPFLYAVDTQWMRRALTDDLIPGWPARLATHDFAALQLSAQTVARYIKQGNAVVLCHDPGTTPFDLAPLTALS